MPVHSSVGAVPRIAASPHRFPRTCSGCSPAREARDLACAPGVGGQERRPCQEGASSTTLAVRSVDVCMWSRAWSQRACKRRRTSHKKPTHTPADPRLREDIDLRDCHLSSHAVLLENREHATFYVTTFDGRVPLVGDALAPLPCATLGAGMPRGMVHRDQVWGRCRSRITCQRERDAPLGTSGVLVSLSGMRRGLVRWRSSMAGVRQHETPACRPAWDGWATGRRGTG